MSLSQLCFGQNQERRLNDTPAEAQHEVQRALLLDVVVRQRAPVLKLLPGENEALLVRRNPLLVLDLALHVVDRVRRLDVQRDGLPRQRLDENLHGAPPPPPAPPM